MHSKKPNISIGKYEKKGLALAAKISPQFDVDAIHDFRTTIKKMRALLRAFGGSRRPLTASFKNLVRISGELRNVQLLLRDTETEKERLAGFRGWLTASAAALQKAWDKAYDPGILRRQHRKTAQQEYKNDLKKAIPGFSKKKISRIRGILCLSPPDDLALHEVRKMIKDLEYLCEWAGGQASTGEGEQKPEALKRIAKQAGNFNDRRIALEWLEAYIKDHDGDPSDPAIPGIRQKWQGSAARQRRTLLSALERFVKVSAAG